MESKILLRQDIPVELSRWSAQQGIGPSGAMVCEGWDEPTGDSVLKYTASIAEAFDLARQVLSQLSAVMLVAVTDATIANEHPMLSIARHGLEEVEDIASSVRPATVTQHNHDHLFNSLRAMREVTKLIDERQGPGTKAVVDAVMPRLRHALNELNFASSGLPGVSVVALDQACGCSRQKFTRGAING
jgi:hypothetical protein